MKDLIERNIHDVEALERIYRESVETRQELAFRQAIEACALERPDSVLLSAWVTRLEPSSDTNPPVLPTEKPDLTRHWKIAVFTGVVLGLFYTLFAGDKPPVPIPGEATSLLWICWGPLTALAVLFFLYSVDRETDRLHRYAIPAIGIIPVTLYTALLFWDRSDQVANLFAVHLPFLAWAAVGISLALGRNAPARQGYAFFIKTIEAVLTGGIYFGAGMIFMGLSYGIFSVLGIELPEEGLRFVATWGAGAIPLLAIASVYDPTKQACEQNWSSGLARILRILTRLMMPLALAVLAVYVLWFIPSYFWKPFQERQVLIVYNATILAILVLITASATAPDDQRSPRNDRLLRRAILTLSGLTLLLNTYALAAIVSRIAEFGFTPNRYVVLGWNVVTLLMLSIVWIQLYRSRAETWVQVFRESIARVSILTVIWAFWILIGLPLSFG